MAERSPFDATLFGKQLAMAAFQNPLLQVFMADEVKNLESAGVPQLIYHHERVVLVGSAAAFAIRAYLGSGNLSDGIWNGFAMLWRDYGASAPDRLGLFQLFERRLTGYILAATKDVIRERSAVQTAVISELLKTYLEAIQENAPSNRPVGVPLFSICQENGLTMWKQQVASTGSAMKLAGLPVQEV